MGGLPTLTGSLPPPWAVGPGGLVQPRDMEAVPYGFYPFSGSCCTDCLGFGDVNNLTIEGRKTICKILRGSWVGPGDACNRVNEVGSTCHGWVAGPSYTCSKCICNAHNALVNRHGKAQPFGVKPRRGLHWLMRHRPAAEAYYHQYFDEYLNGGWDKKWTASKLEAIRESERLDLPVPGFVKMFVKREGGHKAMRKARGIQMYKTLSTQSLYARQFCALQKAWCRVFDGSEELEGITLTIASGLNNHGLGRWLRRAIANGATHFYERDGENWDANVNPGLYSVKRKCFGMCGRELTDFLDECRRVQGGCRSRGVYEAYMSYRLDEGTKSGHNDTSIGNGLMNAAVAIEAMLTLGLKGDIIVAGDDLLVAIRGDFDADAFAAVERRCGIIPEYRKFSNWEDVSFISGIFCPDKDDQPCFIPKPGRLLKRLYWSVKTIGKRKREAFVHSVSTGLLPAVDGLPVVDKFLRAHLRPNLRVIPVGKDYSRTFTEHVEFGAPTRAWFANRYGFDPKFVEDYLDTLPRMPGLISNPFIDHMCDVDNADLLDRPTSCGAPRQGPAGGQVWG
jgi:hypothetical protein